MRDLVLLVLFTCKDVKARRRWSATTGQGCRKPLTAAAGLAGPVRQERGEPVTRGRWCGSAPDTAGCGCSS